MTDQPLYAPIPLRWVGPLRLSGNVIDGEEISVPLATYESPLWPSVKRGAKVRLVRDGNVIKPDATIDSLRREKDDVTEVDKGYECGMVLSYPDIQVDDEIQVYEMVEVPRS